jgi:hypothetical protein
MFFNLKGKRFEVNKEGITPGDQVQSVSRLAVHWDRGTHCMLYLEDSYVPSLPSVSGLNYHLNCHKSAIWEGLVVTNNTLSVE